MSNYLGDVLLDISSIHSTLEDGDISPADIEAIAQNMVITRGTVQPLVVRHSGYNKNKEEVYELVYGQLQFRSALRAMEIDPTLEMVRAFVIEGDRDQEVLRQIELLGNQASIQTHIPKSVPTTSEVPIQAPEPPAGKLTASENKSEDKSAPVEVLEKILSSVQKMQKRVHQDYQNLIDQIQQLLPPPPPDKRLIFLNNFLSQSDPKEIQTKLSFLKNANLVTKIISSQPFRSLKDLQKIKGVGKGVTFTKILTWLDEQA